MRLVLCLGFAPPSDLSHHPACSAAGGVNVNSPLTVLNASHRSSPIVDHPTCETGRKHAVGRSHDPTDNPPANTEASPAGLQETQCASVPPTVTPLRFRKFRRYARTSSSMCFWWPSRTARSTGRFANSCPTVIAITALSSEPPWTLTAVPSCSNAPNRPRSPATAGQAAAHARPKPQGQPSPARTTAAGGTRESGAVDRIIIHIDEGAGQKDATAPRRCSTHPIPAWPAAFVTTASPRRTSRTGPRPGRPDGAVTHGTPDGPPGPGLGVSAASPTPPAVLVRPVPPTDYYSRRPPLFSTQHFFDTALEPPLPT